MSHLETDEYIAQVLRDTPLRGTDGRFCAAMEMAETEKDWAVICQEMLIAFKYGVLHPKGIREHVMRKFERTCAFESQLKRWRHAMPHRWTPTNRRRAGWREQQSWKRFRPEGELSSTVGDALPPEVRQKLEALRAPKTQTA